MLYPLVEGVPVISRKDRKIAYITMRMFLCFVDRW